MKSLLTIFTLSIICVGCEHQNTVETVAQDCEVIQGNYEHPFWAVLTSTYWDEEALRDSYAETFNNLYLEKVENRADVMVWREGEILHMINLSSLFMIEPEEIISEWSEKLELAKRYMLDDEYERCIYGTLTRVFNELHIHSEEYLFNKVISSDITILYTDREATQGMSYKEIVEYYSNK
jgi:hypothetical protein